MNVCEKGETYAKILLHIPHTLVTDFTHLSVC